MMLWQKARIIAAYHPQLIGQLIWVRGEPIPCPSCPGRWLVEANWDHPADPARRGAIHNDIIERLGGEGAFAVDAPRISLAELIAQGRR